MELLQENQVTIKIDGNMSIYEATSIHKKLLQSFAENATLNIDLGDVNSCDVTGIQLLFATIKTGREKGKRVILSKVSEAIQETARLVGVQEDIL